MIITKTIKNNKNVNYKKIIIFNNNVNNKKNVNYIY